MNPGKDGGGAPQLGYFPDSTVERINTIQRLKREGVLMSDMVNQLKDEGGASVAPKLAPQEVEPATVSYLAARSSDGAALHVSIDQIRHPAYMINYNFNPGTTTLRAAKSLAGLTRCRPTAKTAGSCN